MWRLPFRNDFLSRLGVLLLVIVLLLGLFGPLVPAVGDPTKIAFGPRLSMPAPGWPLGTDNLGRTLLPRVLQGIRITFLLATAPVLITSAIAVMIGMLAGYLGGWFDELVVRLADVLFSFPSLLLGMILVAILGPGIPGIMVAIVLLTLPLMVRVVRAMTLTVAGRDYVAAARVSGSSLGRLLIVHILPNIAGAVVVQATFTISVSMLIESGLSFLGLGVQPPVASLGSLVHDGSVYLVTAPWLAFAPGIFLACAIFSVNLLGDSLRDRLDPLEARLLK
ncbi:MAG TPA: ABC transporter permease [Phototrophicaceae bacterium]|nr:ABC transporter permease [Phototrophicaceae bacterium]